MRRVPWKRVAQAAAIVAATILVVVARPVVTWAWEVHLRPLPPPPTPLSVDVPRRTGRPAGEIVLAAGGDTLFGAAAQRLADRRGYPWLFRRVVRAFEGADFAMVNLEAPITTHPDPWVRDKRYIYSQSPAVAGALVEAGVGLVSLGNNHALDFGPRGLSDTRAALDVAGIASVGAGADETAARRGVVLAFDGGPRVGVLSYLQRYAVLRDQGWYARSGQPGVAEANRRLFAADIAALRHEADLVIVHLHAGRNYREVTDAQRRIARALIDAGADVVNGHHPHVAQPVEIYRGRPIVYSLGNWVFGTLGRFQKRNVADLGMVARYHIARDGRLRRIELVGLEVDNRRLGMRPRFLPLSRVTGELLPMLGSRGAPIRQEGPRLIVDLPDPSE